MTLHAEVFHEPNTSSFSYVVHRLGQPECVIIDPVMQFNLSQARLDTHFSQKIVEYVQAHHLEVQWLFDTHIHADHLSAAAWLRSQLGGKIAVSEQILQVRERFQTFYDLRDEQLDLKAFDHFLKDGDQLTIGNFHLHVLHVPGHTPADLAFYLPELGIFVGDTLFMPDVGTARCDFPGGDANQLYHSIQRLFSFPDETALWLCHDYPPEGRSLQHRCTIAEQKQHNIHVGGGTPQADFVARRMARDATLDLPKLMLAAIQVNIQAGELPKANNRGQQFLKIPLNPFSPTDP